MADTLIDRVPEDARRSLEQRTVRRTFGRGETIWYEGDRADGVHVIDSGHVAVRGMTPDGDEATLAILGPDDVFGEMALLGPDQRRSATIVAVERTQTRHITSSDWDLLRSSHAAVDAMVMEMLAGYVRRLGEHLTEALFVPGPTRVIRHLIRLCASYPASEDGSVVLTLTKQDLADLAGTSRQSVSTMLNSPDLQGCGVELGRGRVVVRDLEALESLEQTLPQSKRDW